METAEEEEDKEACMGFASWEEQIYWSHFQYTNFFRWHLPGSDKSLAIPEHFSRHVRKKLPETVGLKGPSGIKWKVGLVARGCTTFLEQGWEEFVKDHSLRQNDLLVFQYDGDSTFEVTMFDRRSTCEIVSTYFVRERGINEELRDGVPLERNTLDCSPVLFYDACLSKKFASDGIDKQPEASLKLPVLSLKAIGKATQLKRKKKGFDVVGLADSGNASSKNKETHTKLDIRHPSPDSAHLTRYGWSGKIVTRTARRMALKHAAASISKKGFTIVMTPSRLKGNGRYYAQIPPLITQNLAFSEKQDVVLRINGNSWRVKLVGGVIKNKQSHKGGSFSGGWKNFVRDNNLQEYDVCAFEPVVAEKTLLFSAFRFSKLRPKKVDPNLWTVSHMQLRCTSQHLFV